MSSPAESLGETQRVDGGPGTYPPPPPRFTVSAETTEDECDYEGAHFLLTYQDKVVLAKRLKKAEDRAADPVDEIEVPGGKVHAEDRQDPYRTAFAKLVDETGGDFLDDDWRLRTGHFRTFQPFTGRWIWTFPLALNDREMERLTSLDVQLDDWDAADCKPPHHCTGRSAPVRKALSELLVVDRAELLAYVKGFAATHLPNAQPPEDRMKAAKRYGLGKTLSAQRLASGQVTHHRLRGFNLVILEQHITLLVDRYDW